MAQTQQRRSPKERRRRRRHRIVSMAVFTIVTLGLAWFFESRMPTTVLLVRHAETDTEMAAGGDPPLNARGRARAVLLADFLEEIDVLAGVDAIYASEFRRTRETAAPLAGRLNIEIEIADPYDVDGFIKTVLHQHRGEIVLIVSHSDVIAPLVKELHGHQNLPEIGPEDFDDLYIVSVPWWGKVKTLRLPYSIGWQAPHFDIGISSSE